jgi:hypothetical protein
MADLMDGPDLVDCRSAAGVDAATGVSPRLRYREYSLPPAQAPATNPAQKPVDVAFPTHVTMSKRCGQERPAEEHVNANQNPPYPARAAAVVIEWVISLHGRVLRRRHNLGDACEDRS